MLPDETIAGFLWRGKAERLRAALAKVPEFDAPRLLYLLERYSLPWPEWVLRMAAKRYHFLAPTFEISEIEGAMRWGHWVFFEMTLNGTSKPPSSAFVPGRNNFEICGRILGHMEAGNNALRRLLAPYPSLQAEHLAEAAYRTDLVWGAAKNLLGTTGLSGAVVFSKALTDAEAHTLDENGQFRDAPADKLYDVILERWPEVELLSGPTALAELLSDQRGASDKDQHLDRVKKICRRFGIRFLPSRDTSLPGAVPGQ